MIHSTTSRTAHRECCQKPECETGLRNNYFEGKRLTAASFQVEQTYLVERRRLLNRAIHGWGVVYGFAVSAGRPDSESGRGRLTIGAGLALDRCGRELLATETSLVVSGLIFLNQAGVRTDLEGMLAEASELRGREEGPLCWLLSVHYAEKKTSLVKIPYPCHCEQDEWDHTCETVRYSIQCVPCSKCCTDFECELDCDCEERPCEKGSLVAGRGEHHTAPGRGGSRCLCEHLTEHLPRLLPGGECRSLYKIDEPCGPVWVDLKKPVPLACVQLVPDPCDRVAFGETVEACGPRRLVKRNDLLFDLIRGCDLTRISRIGWEAWHRRQDPIPFDEFQAALGPAEEGRHAYVTRDFWVEFSRPVRRDTLRPDCFAMTILTTESREGWWEPLRVPIVDVATSEWPGTDDREGLVSRATMVVDGAWLGDAVRGDSTLFQERDHVAFVELEVRGDFIIDCNGQTLDANAVGLRPAPTGNGTPGGTFRSTFCVAPGPPPRRRHSERGLRT